MNRPEPGTTTVTEIKVLICARCRCMIDLDLCSPYCELDGAHTKPEHQFYAVYERTDKFLRDE
jgi:hypothetical protein